MDTKLVKMVGLVLLTVLAGLTPVLGGCGGGEGEKTTGITIGFLADFTGPSALTSAELHKGWTDYMKMVEADNPIPGAKTKLVTYDTRLDYSRVVPGYIWLKAQGAKLIWDYSPIFHAMLKDKHLTDKIPSYTFVGDPQTLNVDWMYSFSVTYPMEAEAIIEWILQDWDSRQQGRAIKVGYIGFSGYQSAVQMSEVFNSVHSQNPQRFTYKEVTSPIGSTAFATEITQLKDCDIIIVNVLGPSMASFLRESRERGYTGRYLGSSLGFMGFWDLVRNAVPDMTKMDGALAMHSQMLWTDQSAFMAQLTQSLQRFRSADEAAQLRKGTSWPTGYITGMILADVVRRAVAAVGAENVDSAAINDALKGIDMTVDGWGESWKFRDDSNILYRMFRAIQYKALDDEWHDLSGWFMAPAFR